MSIRLIFVVGSVLLMDDVKSTDSVGGSEIAINMDVVDKQRYQQQLQLIDQQVNET